MGRLDPVLYPVNLLIGGRLGRQSTYLGVNGSLHLVQIMSFRGGHLDDKLSGNLSRMVAHGRALGDLLFVDQTPMQSGAEAVGEDPLQKVQGSIVRVHVRRCRPSDIQPW